MTVRPDHPDAAPGDRERLVAGRYRLGEVVGRGGMATIYRAQDMRDGRVVALKVLRPEIGADVDLADRFRREALAATVLRHRNIVGCLDTGSDAAGPFMVMELIEGEDLAARLRRDGRLLPGDVARIGLDVARGLGAAHLRGIVHRDVKPSNILLARDGRAMITDFGIARLAADAEAALPGTTLGSVQYFSPEQAQGTTTTPASDVYGLGLVLYEALTGQRPWHGDTSAQLALARVGAVAPSPRDVRPEVPTALDGIVRRSLAADPAARFPNGNALATALEPLVVPSDGFEAERPPAVRPAGRPRRITPVRSVGFATKRPARRFARVQAVGAAALVTLVIGAISMVALGATRSGPAADVTTRPTTAGHPATAEAVVTHVPTPVPTPTAPPVDLCRPILDVACSLGAGRYAPARFRPSVAFTLGDGWSTSLDAPGLLVLARDDGLMTFASGVTGPGDNGKPFGDGTAKAVVAGIAATKGLKATKTAAVKIDGHKGRSTDVTPVGSGRRAVFTAGGRTFYVEGGRTTRIVALDTDDGPLVIVIEPSSGHTLRQALDTADVVASTLTFP